MANIDNWNQESEESYEEWKQRVLVAKARKQCKLSWRDVIDLIGIDLSVDTVRHEAYGRMQAQDLQDARGQEAREAGRSTASLTEYEEEQASLKREKMRMQDQKRELNKLLREWARAEHIQDTIESAVEKAAEANPLVVKSYPISFGEKEAVLLLSDLHTGQYSDTFTNIYNDAEFRSRMQLLLDKTIQYGRDNNIKAIHVMNLGDIINGIIHVSTRVSSTENVIQQLMTAAETICSMLTELARTFPDVKFYSVRGNHDRVTPNKQEAITAESFGDIIPWYVSARMQPVKNVEIVENMIDGEIIVARISDSTVIYGVHGDKDKPQDVVQNLTLMLGIKPDIVVMGHRHSIATAETHGSLVISNGCLCGDGEYNIGIRKTSRPSQTLLIINNDGLECTYRIRLDGAES